MYPQHKFFFSRSLWNWTTYIFHSSLLINFVLFIKIWPFKVNFISHVTGSVQPRTSWKSVTNALVLPRYASGVCSLFSFSPIFSFLHKPQFSQLFFLLIDTSQYCAAVLFVELFVNMYHLAGGSNTSVAPWQKTRPVV